jgi:hypothetical protein
MMIACVVAIALCFCSGAIKRWSVGSNGEVIQEPVNQLITFDVIAIEVNDCCCMLQNFTKRRMGGHINQRDAGQ